MRIIMSAVGEYVDVTNGDTSEPYPHKLGTHSCGAEATLHEVSDDWRAVVCRSCNFRQLILGKVVIPVEMMAKFFKNLKSLGHENWNSLHVLKEATRLTLYAEFSESYANEISRNYPGQRGFCME